MNDATEEKCLTFLRALFPVRGVFDRAHAYFKHGFSGKNCFDPEQLERISEFMDVRKKKRHL